MPATSTAGRSESRRASATAPAGHLDPGAQQADVELDEQRRARAPPLERRRQPLRRGRAVDRHREVDALGGEARQPLPLVLAERRVVDEDARRARLGEDLGLAGLRDGQTTGPERELPQADLGRLVRLGVRPERDRRVRRRTTAGAPGSPRGGRGRPPRRASRPRRSVGRPGPRAGRASARPPSRRLRAACAEHRRRRPQTRGRSR